MNRQQREHAREKRNAKKRVRFRYVDNGIPLYDRPCGCPNGNYLSDGVMQYQYSSMPFTDHSEDLIECLQCRAVWRFAEIQWDSSRVFGGDWL